MQTDIKRVIAYSTCSQLGYMFIAAGATAYQASIFHLMTHAFFKALLFLCAGSVIHAMSDEQDMRKMGGIWRKIPITYVCMWIGSLAIAGVPFFAGYWSKDAIIESAYVTPVGMGMYGFWTGTLAAFLTAFYSWRLLIMTFHGAPRANAHTMAHVHESTPWMTIPLMVLAVGATFSGWALHDLFHRRRTRLAFWAGSIVSGPANHVLVDIEHVPWFIELAAHRHRGARHRAGLPDVHGPPRAFPHGWPPHVPPGLRVPRFTNGISTSCTTSSSSARRRRSRGCCGIPAMRN